MYKVFFDRLAQYFSEQHYASDFSEARNTYFKCTGIVFQDDPLFESRMTAFFEWYLLERCLWDSGIPPIRLFELSFSDSLSEHEKMILKSLRHTTHSVFLVKNVSRSDFRVMDLISQKVVTVSEFHQYPGLQKGDLMDGRLIKIDGYIQYTESMWMHPSSAFDFIKKEAFKLKHENFEVVQRFLFDLAYLRIKRDQFKHVSIDQIYCWDQLQQRVNDSNHKENLEQGTHECPNVQTLKLS